MSIFSSFSRAARDRDGSWTVYCTVCREPICRTTVQLGKIKCELCTRVENGEKLTPEAVEMYRLSKQGVMGVTMINTSKQDELNKGPRSQGNGFLKAIGRMMGHDPSEAELVVQEKHRGRLFEQVDLEKLGDAPPEDSFGSMESLAQLMEKEDQR